MFWEKSLVVMDYLEMTNKQREPQSSLVEGLLGLWLCYIFGFIDTRSFIIFAHNYP